MLSELGHEVIVAHARNVRLIGESRRKDDRFDARTLARLARIDPQLLGSGAASQCASPIASDGDPGTSRIGAGADGVDQHGARTDEVLRRAAAKLQPALPLAARYGNDGSAFNLRDAEVPAEMEEVEWTDRS